MALEIPAAAKEKVITGVSAFGTGVAMSFLVKKWPTAGILSSIIATGGGLLGALVTKGWIAEIGEGVGAGGAAILGSSIAWLPEAGTQAKKGGLTYQLKKGDQTVTLALKSGAVGATAEAMAMASKVKSVLEF